jgi:hypothetical protein
MGEKVVLPNFDLPRDGTRVAMRVAWGMGGVVVLATFILGLAMWHHRSLEIASQQEAAARAEAARRAAMALRLAAMAPRLAAMAPPPAPKVVEKAAPMGGSATTLANVAGTSAASSSTGAAPAAADAERPVARAHRRSAKAGRAHGKSGAALLERIEGKGGKPASKPAKASGGHSRSDDDFLDSLLKK